MPPYLRLIRGGNVAISFLGTVVAGLAVAGLGFSVPLRLVAFLLLAGASPACVTAAGNVLNDLGDVGSDRQNHPDRPLVTGAISLPAARSLAIGLFVAAPLLALPVALAQPALAVVLALAIGAVLAYEYRFKSRGLPGNLLVAFLTGAVFLYGGSAAGGIVAVVPFAGLAFLATLSREVIKDMEDAKGDVDRRTLPQTRGFGTASIVARASVGLAIALSPAPAFTFLAGQFRPELAYLALVGIADAVFVASVAWLPERLHREQSLSKGAMSLALLAFLSTALR